MKTFIVIVSLSVMMVSYVYGYTKGHDEAVKKALSTNPVSHELEMVCAGLWVGEQNKKYYKKEGK